MPEPLKNMINHELLRKIAMDIQSVHSPFQVDEFIRSTMDKTWDSLELKDRTYKVTSNLGEFLPKDYKTAISIIDKVVMNYGTWLDSFAWFFPV